MAIRFIRNVITIRTRPVAAALMWKSLWGRESQLNICIGMTVKAEFSQSKFRNGKSDCRGELGRKAMYVRAPIVMTGAVSPTRSEEHTSELQSLMRSSYAVISL